MAHAVRAREEWPWSETYTTLSSEGPPAASRATSSAVRFAADPPLTSRPAVPSGIPSQLRNQSIISSSIWVAAGDSLHTQGDTLAAVAISSATAAGQVVK